MRNCRNTVNEGKRRKETAQRITARHHVYDYEMIAIREKRAGSEREMRYALYGVNI